MINFQRAFRPEGGINLDDLLGVFAGDGDPAATVEVAPTGSLFLRSDGAPYVKASSTSADWKKLLVTPTTTKGDLIVRNTAGDVRLPVGNDLQILIADSNENAGVRWVTIPIIQAFVGSLPSIVGSTIMPFGTVPPLITDGTEIASQLITPRSSNPKFSIRASISATTDTNNSHFALAVFRDSVYIGAAIRDINSTGDMAGLTVNVQDSPGSAAPVTYSIRVGADAATWAVNRQISQNTYGGLHSGWEIQEI